MPLIRRRSSEQLHAKQTSRRGYVPVVGYTPAGHPSDFIDLSLETPDQQFNALSAMLEAEDAASPAPDTTTPPFGEPTDPDEYIPEVVLEQNYMPAPDVDAVAVSDVPSLLQDAYGADIPEWDWENDDQYFGLGVPPGVPNYGQPIESGHSQIVRPNPSAELGWDQWSGKFVIARVPRHENNFTRYNAGTSRGHSLPPEKWLGRGPSTMPLFTQQQRDLMLSEIQRRGKHNVVVQYVSPPAYTDQVLVVDPTVYASPEIGPEGVLP